MRAAALLGLRLALRGAGRGRAVAAAVAAFAGALALLCAAALAGALRSRGGHTYTDAEMTWLGLTVLVGIGLPVLALVATAARLSAELRDRRLANLRLLGLTPSQTRYVAGVETGVAALAGAVAAALAFPAVRPLFHGVHLAGAEVTGADLRPGPLGFVLALVGVPLAAAAVAAFPARLDPSSALRAARQGEARPPRLLRVVPLIVGIGMCAFVITRAHDVDDATDVAMFFCGTFLTGVGVLLVTPLLVHTAARLLLRAPGPAATIAARRLVAQPAGVHRVVSALLIALFLVTGGRYVVASFETLGQYQQAARTVTEQQRVTVDVPYGQAAATAERARGVAGVTGTVVVGSLRTSCADGPSGCFDGLVASCEQLRAVTRVTACRDDAVQWLHDPQPYTEGATLAWSALLVDRDLKETSTVVTTGLPAAEVGYADGVDRRLEMDSLDGQILIPPGLVPDLPADVSATVLVLAEPGRDLAERLSAAGIGSLGVSGDVADYDFVAGLRATVWALAGVVLAVGMLGFGLGAVDRAIARRRELVRLQLLGVPARVIRRSQWLEAAVPIGVGSVLAVALGMLAGGAYLSLVNEMGKHIPWAYALSVLGASALAAVAVAGLTVLAASPRIRPEHIRAE